MTKINKEGWEIKKLGEVGTFLRCNGILKSDFVEHGMPCIHYGQIHTKFDTATSSHLSEISEELFEKSKKASKGDIIIAITSEDIEGSCKCTAWLGDYDVAVGAHAAIYKHTQCPKFVAYYFKSGRFYVGKAKYARGFKVMEIKPKDIAEIDIPLPPLPIQQRIVEELDEINAIISAKKQQLSKLDELAQSIFYNMFGDPVANEKEWEVKKLGEVCEITSSKRIFAEEYVEMGIPFYRSKEVIEKSKKLPISVELYISEDKYNEIKEKFGIPAKGDILITAVGTIGKIWSVDTDEPFYFKDGNLVWLKNIDRRLVENNYFNYTLALLIEEYKKVHANGAAYNALTIVKLKEMGVPLPPLPLQETFAARVSAIEDQKAAIAASIEKMQTLLDARMQEYFG